MLYDVSERSVQEWLAILSACHAAARLRRKTLRQLEVVRRRMKQRQRDAVAQVVAMIAQGLQLLLIAAGSCCWIAAGGK